MPAHWLSSLLERGLWTPTSDERAAAIELLRSLPPAPAESTPAARRHAIRQAEQALRTLLGTRGPSFYRIGNASLYSIVGALVVRFAAVPPHSQTDGRAPGTESTAYAVQLATAELEVQELTALLEAVTQTNPSNAPASPQVQ